MSSDDRPKNKKIQQRELCEQLVETYMAKNKKIESEITAQIKTKRILLQFILEMWEKGLVIENDKSGRNTVEKRNHFICTAEF